MSQGTGIIITRLTVGLTALILLVVLMLDWPVGLLLMCTALLAGALINLRRPALFEGFWKKKKAADLEKDSGDPSYFLSKKDFVPTIKLTCRDTTLPVEFTIDKPQFLIGRSRSCNYVLDFSNLIGRQHCTIDYHSASKQYTIRDNASKHGTKLNGIILTPSVPMPLHLNDEITIDRYRFHVTSISYH